MSAPGGQVLGQVGSLAYKKFTITGLTPARSESRSSFGVVSDEQSHSAHVADNVTTPPALDKPTRHCHRPTDCGRSDCLYFVLSNEGNGYAGRDCRDAGRNYRDCTGAERRGEC